MAGLQYLQVQHTLSGHLHLQNNVCDSALIGWGKYNSGWKLYCQDTHHHRFTTMTLTYHSVPHWSLESKPGAHVRTDLIGHAGVDSAYQYEHNRQSKLDRHGLSLGVGGVVVSYLKVCKQGTEPV